MVFNFNNKKAMQQLQAENEQLKQKNLLLEEELKQLSQSNLALSDDMSKAAVRYNNQEELNKLWLQSSTLVNQIRESLANSSKYLT